MKEAPKSASKVEKKKEIIDHFNKKIDLEKLDNHLKRRSKDKIGLSTSWSIKWNPSTSIKIQVKR